MSDAIDALSWEAFIELADAGKLTADIVQNSIRIDHEASDPFDPVFKFGKGQASGDASTVDSEKILLALALDEARKKQGDHSIASNRSLRTFAVKPRIGVAGDSWFNLPPLLCPKDLVDFLDEEYDVRQVAKWSKTLEGIVRARPKQYVQILSGGNIHHFLVSGGGNDILGNIGKYVIPRNPDDSDPDNAISYIRPEFKQKVDDIIGYYKEVVDDVERIGDVKINIYVHGYANAIPKPHGKYIGSRLTALGFDPSNVGPLAQAIVATMVALFNKKLEFFANSRKNVNYLDLRPHMGSSDWNWDEIHPNEQAARRLANVFSAAIQQNTSTA